MSTAAALIGVCAALIGVALVIVIAAAPPRRGGSTGPTDASPHPPLREPVADLGDELLATGPHGERAETPEVTGSPARKRPG